MQTIGSLVVLVYALGSIALGAFGAPFWTPAILAFFGVALAFIFVPAVAKTFAQGWHAGETVGIVEFVVVQYLTQVVYIAIPYGIGRLGRAIF